MDLQTLHKKTRLSLRQLRYILDHDILPGTRVATDPSKVGRPRSFTEFEGFSIAVAASLREAGLRRSVLSRIFAILAEPKWDTPGSHRPRISPLEAAFSPSKAKEVSIIEIADGRYLTLSIAGNRIEGIDLQANGAISKKYEARVTVTVNLGRVRDELTAKCHATVSRQRDPRSRRPPVSGSKAAMP